MKWNSAFTTPSTKQKPPSVRKTCTPPSRPRSITGQYTKSITRHFDTCNHLVDHAFDDISSRETGAQRNEQTRQCRSGEIEQLRSFVKERVREACDPKRQGKTYTANALNQYTAIGTAFVPSYDANGNQTLVQMTTGTWTVAYNGENRPVAWTKGDIVITMTYDHAGRRISYKKMNGEAQESYVKFLYKGYLCVQELSADAPWSVLKAFIWDPTESIATRPLVFTEGEQTSFYMHDGNKNVTDIISSTSLSSDVTHYDYAPFGAVIRTATATVSTQNSSPITHNSVQSAAANPFRFSSEYHDDDLGLVYYNYRHYNSTDGRWINRDPIEEGGGLNLYGFIANSLNTYDQMGLKTKETEEGTCKRMTKEAKNHQLTKDYLEAIKDNKCDLPSDNCDCCLGAQSSFMAYYTNPKIDPETKKRISGNNITMCYNNLKNHNQGSYDKWYLHEVIHAYQACYSEKLLSIIGSDLCKNTMCHEIGAYYIANCSSTSDYEIQKRCVKDSIPLSISKRACELEYAIALIKDPNSWNSYQDYMDSLFTELYDKCVKASTLPPPPKEML